MILCDIYSEFCCLPNFETLITILVGSVFIASCLSKDDSSFSNVIKKVREILETKIGDVFGPGSNYEIAKTETDEKVVFTGKLNDGREVSFETTQKVSVSPEFLKLNTDYRFIKRSVMLLMAMYGAFVLFYCGAYCTLNESSSLFGLLLLSLFDTIFIITYFFMVGRRNASYILFFIFAFLLTGDFLAFIVIAPESWKPIGDEWIPQAHLVANIWTLINLSVMGPIVLLKKIILPTVLLKMAKKVDFYGELTLDINLISLPGIVDKMKYIMDKTKFGDKNNFRTRWVLFFKAHKILQDENLYFNREQSSHGGVNVTPISECTNQLEEHINKSNFNALQKKILRKTIKKDPHSDTARSEFDKMITDMVKDRESVVVNNRRVKRFIKNGIIIRKERK